MCRLSLRFLTLPRYVPPLPSFSRVLRVSQGMCRLSLPFLTLPRYVPPLPSFSSVFRVSQGMCRLSLRFPPFSDSPKVCATSPFVFPLFFASFRPYQGMCRPSWRFPPFSSTCAVSPKVCALTVDNFIKKQPSRKNARFRLPSRKKNPPTFGLVC